MLTLEQLRAYFRARPGTTEEFPFDSVTLVAKVCGRMYALVMTECSPLEMNLKCLPEKAEVLREEFPAITPGYHMNKRHWNTLRLDGSLPDELVLSLIDDSYALVVAKLPKAKRPA